MPKPGRYRALPRRIENAGVGVGEGIQLDVALMEGIGAKLLGQDQTLTGGTDVVGAADVIADPRSLTFTISLLFAKPPVARTTLSRPDVPLTLSRFYPDAQDPTFHRLLPVDVVHLGVEEDGTPASSTIFFCTATMSAPV